MIGKFLKCTAFATILITMLHATPTSANPSDSTVTQGQIGATQEQINDFEIQIQQLDDRIIQTMEKSQALNDKVKTQQGKITETEAEIEKAKKDLVAHQEIFAERLKILQLDSQQSTTAYAELLLSSTSISEFFARFTAISQIINSDTDLLKGLDEKQQVLEEAEQKLHTVFEQLQESQEELASDQKIIEEDKNKVEKALAEKKNKLQNQQEQLAQQVAEAERQAQLANQVVQQEQQQTQQQTSINDASKSTPVVKVAKATNTAQVAKATNTANVPNSGGANSVIGKAKQYLGVPYVWGGTSPNGFDCSGFVKYVYNSVGINLPRVSRDQQNAGTRISPSQVQPGDLVFNGSPAYHVGIYIGNGQYIHAPQTGDVVKIATYSPSKFSSAARVLR